MKLINRIIPCFGMDRICHISICYALTLTVIIILTGTFGMYPAYAALVGIAMSMLVGAAKEWNDSVWDWWDFICDFIGAIVAATLAVFIM